MSTLKYLVIHCTDTPEGREVTKADIERWHIKERGWSRVGYSDMIHIDGCLENLIAFNQDNTVDNWEISNGAKGFNGVARHVVYVGGCDKNFNPKDTRTPEQINALEVYVRYMILRHPDIKVVGHNELSSKACPSFNVGDWLRSLCIPCKHIGR
ncbi:N-acetylmuramoyl-L-alanine amidase [Winogradskyella psychrotolerans]|uniref:N-acetylmuramoyl-L-alanine amidase n=1 Tax=Winogradskyella psychrotolerans TaxID=1344585 RepID=UPI001C06AD84|nr:N-acetylmuramoyl-L-alanine amidase [Winogradskyella psychrotolerans]MBU2923051.1 N-acetylmuramoyl-L-alanine amidase [Winogradskyella psychrotolerans]